MIVEFLRDGAPECPLVRFYSTKVDDFLRLKSLVDRLATGEDCSIELGTEDGIALGNMAGLTLRNSADSGLTEVDPNKFDWSLTPYDWESVSMLLQPFLEDPRPNTYQWLDEAGRGFSSGLPVLVSMSDEGTW